MKNLFRKYKEPIIFYGVMSLLMAVSVISLFAAARGSGSYTTYGVGNNDDKLYLPAAREDPGWGTDLSTNSLNKNSILISSAIRDLEILAGNTNYAQIRESRQSGLATVNLASGTYDFLRVTSNVYVSSGNLTNPTYAFQLSTGTGWYLFQSNVVAF